MKAKRMFAVEMGALLDEEELICLALVKSKTVELKITTGSMSSLLPTNYWLWKHVEGNIR